jgi:ATP-independent RNA helicase DbpA
MIPQILEKLKIDALNDMQQLALKTAEQGKDMVLLSPTGSGKTLAFLLPVLSNLNPTKEGVQCLVIVPSRELAIQIESVFRQMGTGFKVNCCYGGHKVQTERNNLDQAPAVLIGTPGRLTHHIRKRTLDLSTATMLVLDEFDKALEFGFQKDMEFIIAKMTSLQQRILTSATQGLAIPSFTGIVEPTYVNYLTTQAVPPKLTIKAVRSNAQDKFDALLKLIGSKAHQSILVFCNHREAVDRISEILTNRNLSHDVFHGGLEQDDRSKALVKFRNGSHKLLITTDLASRGLDIPEIECVIHYQLPASENAFIHRNGRTARMHAEGVAYLILGENETPPAYIKGELEIEALEALTESAPVTDWVTLYISAGKKDKINKVDIVGLFLQKGGLAKEELGLIEVQDFSSFVAVKRTKVNELLTLISTEKLKKKTVKIEIAR